MTSGSSDGANVALWALETPAMGILRAGLTGHFRGRTLPAHSTFILASGYL